MPMFKGDVFDAEWQHSGRVRIAGKSPGSVRICYDLLCSCVCGRLQHAYY